MLNVFIDSQIWLSFYKLSSEDLEQLKKLKGLLKKEIKLFITQQVVDEVKRNRESVILETLKGFERSPDIQFPTFVKGYSEYTNIKNVLTELQENHKEWLEQIKKDIRNQTLVADEIIAEIFNPKAIMPIADKIVQKAKLRYNRGNPPGKDKSYGDAINWELLIDSCPQEETLYFIGNDKDFLSIDKSEFSPFLKDEWQTVKGSKIILCKTLSNFFNQHTHLIKLADTEQEVNDAIKELEASGSFAKTHSVISTLQKFSEDVFTEDQIEWLCKIAIENSQVQSIIDDLDVNVFLTKIVKLFGKESKEEYVDTPNSIWEVNQKLNYPNKKILPF